MVAFRALALDYLEVGNRPWANSLLLGVFHDGPRQRMIALRFHRRGQLQKLMLRYVRLGKHLANTRPTFRQRSRLIHRDCLQPCRRLYVGSAFDEYTVSG